MNHQNKEEMESVKQSNKEIAEGKLLTHKQVYGHPLTKDWEEELKLWRPWFYGKLDTPDKDELIRLISQVEEQAKAEVVKEIKKKLEGMLQEVNADDLMKEDKHFLSKRDKAIGNLGYNQALSDAIKILE